MNLKPTPEWLLPYLTKGSSKFSSSFCSKGSNLWLPLEAHCQVDLSPKSAATGLHLQFLLHSCRCR